MTKHYQADSLEKNVVTRYGVFTKYETQSSMDLDGNDSGSTKNFPKAFVPMQELEESSPEV